MGWVGRWMEETNKKDIQAWEKNDGVKEIVSFAALGVWKKNI